MGTGCADVPRGDLLRGRCRDRVDGVLSSTCAGLICFHFSRSAPHPATTGYQQQSRNETESKPSKKGVSRRASAFLPLPPPSWRIRWSHHGSPSYGHRYHRRSMSPVAATRRSCPSTPTSLPPQYVPLDLSLDRTELTPYSLADRSTTLPPGTVRSRVARRSQHIAFRVGSVRARRVPGDQGDARVGYIETSGDSLGHLERANIPAGLGLSRSSRRESPFVPLSPPF